MLTQRSPHGLILCHRPQVTERFPLLLGLNILLWLIAPLAHGQETVTPADIGWQAIQQQFAGDGFSFNNGPRRTSALNRGGNGTPKAPIPASPIFSQPDYIKPSNPDAADEFGYSVAVDGNTLVVGVRYEDSASSGVGGNPFDNSQVDAGAVYVFVNGNNGWEQQAYLKPENPNAGDWFGYAVDIDGDTLVVGAPREDSSTVGVDSTPNNSRTNSGAAYIFTRSNNEWTQEAYIKASNTGTSDEFGISVAIDQNTVVIGALSEDSGANGVNSDSSDNAATNAGAAYVFTRTDAQWSQQAYLKASNSDAHDVFGSSVDISGDTIAIGAHGEDSSSSVINGYQGNHSSFQNSGAVYVFKRNNSLWTQQAYIKAPNREEPDLFGVSVAVDGDYLLAGSNLEDGVTAGVGGNPFDNGATNAGAAYLFRRDETETWSFLAYLKATNTGADDRFGHMVSMNNGLALVGARHEDGSATVIDGLDNNLASNAGAAYLYAINGTSVTPVSYLKATNTDANDLFGWSVDVGGGTLAVGAILEDSATNAVNGGQGDNSLNSAGAVYVFPQNDTLYTVGGTVSGLAAGNTLVLQNNESDQALITGNGSFNFPTLYFNGSDYDVTVLAQPNAPSQICTISRGTGTISNAVVNDIQVECALHNLNLPSTLNAVESGFIDVPVHFEPVGAMISHIAFSLDYDETCLNADPDGDGIVDQMTMDLPADYTVTILFDASDTAGEIDISIGDFTPPLSPIPPLDLLTVGLFADCPATADTSPVVAAVDFATSPTPSFGGLDGQDVTGTWADGQVQVWASSSGDCNASGGLSAADLGAATLEIFDDDGDIWLDAPRSDFFGSPQGCDANADEIITAADITCVNQLLFGTSCVPPRLAADSQQPELNVSSIFADDMNWLQVRLTSYQEAVAAVGFSLDLDTGKYDTHLIDIDRNGVPDHLRFPQGQPDIANIRWQAQDSDGELDILLADLAANELADGLLVEIGIPSSRAVQGGLRYARQPQPSFSSRTGTEQPGLATVGDVVFAAGFEQTP